MDIKQIIKDGLPEGLETVTDKVLTAIAKEINTAVGSEFVPKTAYSKQTEKILGLETKIGELEKNGADVEVYKAKIKELEEARAKADEAVKGKDAEIAEIKKGFEADKLKAAKSAALRKQLKNDGANADEDILGLLESKFDLEKLELDDKQAVKDWENVSKSVKEGYAKWFGKTETKGTAVGTPPNNTGGQGEEPKTVYAALKQHYEKKE